MEKKILAIFMSYIIIVASFSIISVAAEEPVKPAEYIDSGISCSEVQELYHNSTTESSQNLWCNNNQDWFSWTCVADGTNAGQLYIKRCLAGCDTKEDLSIVEGGCAAGSISAQILDIKLGYSKEETCPSTITKGALKCNTDNTKSQICLNNLYNAENKDFSYLYKNCECVAETGLCKEDIIGEGDNAFKTDLTVINEQTLECLKDLNMCIENAINAPCTLQERINFLCKYGPEPGNNNYNPLPSDVKGYEHLGYSYTTNGYPNCEYNVWGNPIGFKDPEVQEELNWLASTRENLVRNSTYDMKKSLKKYSGYSGRGICIVGSVDEEEQEGYIQNGVVERQLSDCRIVRVFVSNAKIESVEVCNPGNKQNNICPTQTEEEYKSCFQEVSKLPEDFNFLSTFSTIVQEGELVCDIPLCNDFEHVCEENIFLDDKNSVLGNNNIIQVFNPYDKIDYKFIFSADITENISAVKYGEKRKVLISLYNGGGIEQENENTEQDITPIFNEIEFNASGNAILEGSFNPIVSGIFALNVRVLNQAEDCVARLDQIKIREEPILIVSIDQDEEIINAIETLTTTGNLNNLVTSKDTEYTVAFQEFLSAREACYRSDLFTGYNSPINFCYAYKEKFVNYLTKYAEYNLPPEYADQFILYLEDEEKLTDIANSFESNIRNNIISLFLELGIVEADIAKTITFTYKTELDEDVTGMGSGFFQKALSFISNPLKIFSALFNSANQEEFYEGLRTSDHKLDDMKTAFLILRASLYGNPLETIPIAAEESAAGAAVQEQTHKNDWSRTYNLIRYSGEEGRASSSYSSIKQLFGIKGDIDDDLILQELGFPVEIREKLLEEYKDNTRNINEVATNDLEALKNSINVYAPSVPLFKAINSENIPLITLGFSWLHYFTILESMGRWTAQQDKTYRGVFEKSAFETYDEIMGRYYGGAGAGPFMHNVIYEVKKQFLIELVGNQLQGIIDTFGDEGAMYEKEVGLANKFFDSIEKNIDAINAIQIADMIIGAIASFFMFQGISALVSKATSGSGTVVSKTSFLGKLGSGELGSFGKHIALLFKNNKLLSGLAKVGSAGLDNAVLIAVGALLGWELFSVFAGCISAYGNIPVDETRVHRLERQSKEPECWGRLGQFLVTIGGIGIERYSSSGWLRFGRENPALAKGITGRELLKNDLRSIKVLGKESIIQREKQVLNSILRAERAGVSSVNMEARLAKIGKGGLVELFKKEPTIFQNIDNAIIEGQSLDDMIMNGIIGPDQIEIARAMLQQQGLGSLDVLGPESLQRFDRLTQKGDDLVQEMRQLGDDIDEVAFRNIAKKAKELTEEWNLFLLDYGSIEAKISKRAYAVEFELGSLKAKLPKSIKSSSDDIILDMIENRRAALKSVYKDFPEMVQTSQQRVLAENFKNSLDESVQVVDDAVKAVKNPVPLPKPVLGKIIDDAGEIVGGGIGKNGIISGRLGKGRIAGITDAAGKSSGMNQDVIIVGKKRFGVFDGVSTKVRKGTGDQAAKIAGETMIDSPGNSFDNILNKIETNIKESPGGATTASMGEVIDNELSYVTVGDSPIIVIRNGRAIQLSKPHSNAQSWLDEQLYSPAQLVGPKNARPDKYATLTSALGSHDNSFTYYFNKFTLQENDIVLFTSDGIFNRNALGGEIVIERSNVIAGSRPTIPIETSLNGQIIGHDYSRVVDVFKKYGDDIDGAVAEILKLSRQGNTADNVGMLAYLHGR